MTPDAAAQLTVARCRGAAQFEEGELWVARIAADAHRQRQAYRTFDAKRHTRPRRPADHSSTEDAPNHREAAP